MENSALQISVYYQNVRGLRSKHKRFHCNATSYDLDIIILTETWLKDTFFDAEYFDDSFSVYRRDRLFRQGGGVLIALKNDIFSSERVELPNTQNLEYVCIKANTKSHNIIIYSAYIPPSSPTDLYQSHLSAMQTIAADPDDVLIIVGDFNMPKVQWTKDDDINVLIPTAFDPAFTADFIKGLMGMGVHQVNHLRNKDDRLLDLLFTNDLTNASIHHAKPLTKVDAYHPPILVTFEWHEPNRNNTANQTLSFNFKRANNDDMNLFLKRINFTELFRGRSLEEKVEQFDCILNDAIQKLVPTCSINRNEKCPWQNKRLQALKNKKNKEWKRFKLNGIKEPFDAAFNDFDKLNTELYNAYVEKMRLSLKQNPASFWSCQLEEVHGQ